MPFTLHAFIINIASLTKLNSITNPQKPPAYISPPTHKAGQGFLAYVSFACTTKSHCMADIDEKSQRTALQYDEPPQRVTGVAGSRCMHLITCIRCYIIRSVLQTPTHSSLSCQQAIRNSAMQRLLPTHTTSGWLCAGMCAMQPCVLWHLFQVHAVKVRHEERGCCWAEACCHNSSSWHIGPTACMGGCATPATCAVMQGSGCATVFLL
ncbi:hypothetical protein V8C86DRAFT_1189122 [Haematococcus lacustris]